MPFFYGWINTYEDYTMPSNINFTDIDETFPVPGKTNDTQVLRNNFNTIKSSLASAKSEIETLQNTAASTNSDNNFGGRNIIDANLVDVSYTVTNLEADALEEAEYNIELNGSHLQVLDLSSTVSSSITITLNWPDLITDGEYRYRSVKLGLQSSTARSVNIVVTDSTDIQYDSSYPQILEIDINRIAVLELWTYGTGVVYAKFLGKFSTTRQGTPDQVDIATTATLGVVKVGSGLNITAAGVLSGFSGNYSDLTNAPYVPGLLNGTDLKDSVIKTALSVASAEDLSNNILLSSVADADYYSVGQIIRIFGAGDTLAQLPAPASIKAFARGDIEDSGSNSTFSYKACEFNPTTGYIGQASDSSTGIIVAAGERLSSGEIQGSNFNNENYISVEVTRTSSANGVAIYRKINSSSFDLIAVLGPSDAGSAYFDYYDFDYTEWSGKSPTNTYTINTRTLHIPVTVPISPRLGWIDTEIIEIDSSSGKLTIADSVYFESSVTVVHNDTAYLQEKINESSDSNRNFLELESKVYYVSELILPNKFTLAGMSDKTQIKKLPWSSANSNKIIRGSGMLSNVSVEKLEINGSMQNQFLVDASSDESANYAIHLQGNTINFDRVVVSNTIGGGISSKQSTDLRIADCKISNSGLSDQFDASPILADECTNLRITGTHTENFASAIDISLTNIGVVTGNIVKNCGSGILTFGSRNLLSSPNLILGPAGEFIPGPDIYNSEYDAVNINISGVIGAFFSDTYVYQENGELFDLTVNKGKVSYRVNKLRKIDNVEEIVQGDLVGANNTVLLTSYDTGIDKSNGQFRFVISAENVNKIKTDYAYSTLKEADAYHVGLVYHAVLSEYSPISTIVDSGTVSVAAPKLYEITLTTTGSLFIGAAVRLSGHGGSLEGGQSLNDAIGIVRSLNTSTNKCSIEYTSNINTSAPLGANGILELENTFVLAKGKIQ